MQGRGKKWILNRQWHWSTVMQAIEPVSQRLRWPTRRCTGCLPLEVASVHHSLRDAQSSGFVAFLLGRPKPNDKVRNPVQSAVANSPCWGGLGGF